MASTKKVRRRRAKTITKRPIAKHFIKMQCPHCLKTSITILHTLNDEVVQLPYGEEK